MTSTSYAALPTFANWLSCGLLAVAVVGLVARRSAVAGSTLIGAWAWLQAALMSLLLVQLADHSGAFASPNIAASFEYLAALGTLTPVMAVMGAKRPQHGAWHFIVASLWIVLALPAADVLFIRTGGGLKIHTVQCWFLAILISLGIVNYAPTRFWPAAILYGLGQIALLGRPVRYLPSLGTGFAELEIAAGSALVGLAVILVCLNLPPRRTPALSWNRAWLNFRDAYGALWGTRVMDRMNDAAGKLDWPTRLTWSGFCDVGDEQRQRSGDVPGRALDSHVERSFRMLLRRFVSSDWYAER
jgi:hypothetical protein